MWFTVAGLWVKMNKPGEHSGEVPWRGSKQLHKASSQQRPQKVLILTRAKNRLRHGVWLGFLGIYCKEFGNPPRRKVPPPPCALHWCLVVLVGKKKLVLKLLFWQCLSFSHQKSLWRETSPSLWSPVIPLHSLLGCSRMLWSQICSHWTSPTTSFAEWVFQPCCLFENLQGVNFSCSLAQDGKCFTLSQATLKVPY